MVMQWSGAPVFTVKPAKGMLSLLPKTRNYQFVFRGYGEDVSVKALVDGKETDTQAIYDKATRSTTVKVSAAPTSEIKLLISGEMLITDNGDLLKRCSDLLQKMQLEVDAKVQVMKVLNDPKTTDAVKLRKLNFKCDKSVQHHAVMEALLEQMTLTESFTR